MNPLLSERERQILQQVATGLTNRQIAAALDISENTVKVHVRNIFAKIGVASRTEASLYAVRTGLIILESAAPPATDTTTQAPAVDPVPAQAAEPPAPDAAVAPVTTRHGVQVTDRRRFLILAATAGLAAVGAALWRATTPAIVAPPVRPVTEDSRWQRFPPLGEPRAGVVFAVMDGVPVALGGGTTTASQLRVDRYDEASATWQALPDLPFPLHAALTWSDGAGLVIADRAAGQVRWYSAGVWSAVPLPEPDPVLGVVRWQGDIVVLTAARCWRYQAAWQELAALPAERTPVTLVAADQLCVVCRDGSVWAWDADVWGTVGGIGSVWDAGLGYGVLGTIVLLSAPPAATLSVYTPGSTQSIVQAVVPIATPLTQSFGWRTMIVYADAAGQQIFGYQILFQNFVPIAQ